MKLLSYASARCMSCAAFEADTPATSTCSQVARSSVIFTSLASW